jgi:hypothetical protein
LGTSAPILFPLPPATITTYNCIIVCMLTTFMLILSYPSRPELSSSIL